MKLKNELPTREKLLAGLTLRDVHAPFARAELAVHEAEQALARRRAELQALEAKVADLPSRIQSGHARASALTDVMRERDAAALQIPTAEAAIVTAREKLATEAKAAQSALDREFNRRAEMLEKAAAEVTPMLDELLALASALAAARGQGAQLGLDWPCCPTCEVRTRIAMSSSGPAPVSLTWSHKP